MQGFGTGVGQTGLYLTGIGIPITAHPMLCPGVSAGACTRPTGRVSKPAPSSTSSSASPSSTTGGGVDPADAGFPSKEYCDA